MPDERSLADVALMRDLPVFGTFTATLVCGTSGTITLTAGAGGNLIHYVKFGRWVFFFGLLSVASVAAPVGILTMGGLPFPSQNVASGYSAINVRGSNLAATATTSLQGIVEINATTCRIEKFAAGALGNLSGDIQAGTSLVVSGHYLTP